MPHAASSLPGNGLPTWKQPRIVNYASDSQAMPLSSDPISFSPVDNAIVLSPMAISCSPSEFMELLLSLGLSTDRRLDAWKKRWRVREERRPEPRIPHPCFPQALVRCRDCNSAKGIAKTVSRKPGSINEGRSYFICKNGAGQPCHNRFICWADLQGVAEENGRCDCGYPVRKQVTNSRNKTKGIEFVTCAFGSCDVWEVWYRWEYDLLMRARSGMDDAIFAVQASEELFQALQELNEMELSGRSYSP
ncbi:hypothetical protein BJ166DRAFT_537688 [Pestalotiopsis sp. NC0098]|nr:hypothetical protein BJ166DRAFT_537688 [Pestalotiopsis sp. NC0098]